MTRAQILASNHKSCHVHVKSLSTPSLPSVLIGPPSQWSPTWRDNIKDTHVTGLSTLLQTNYKFVNKVGAFTLALGPLSEHVRCREGWAFSGDLGTVWTFCCVWGDLHSYLLTRHRRARLQSSHRPGHNLTHIPYTQQHKLARVQFPIGILQSRASITNLLWIL